MGYISVFLVAFVGAAILAAVLCRLVMLLPVKDGPTEARKTQAAPVQTAGGLGIAAALVIVTIVLARLAGAPVAETGLVVIGGALAALLLGLADDTMPLPATVRLAGMVLIAVAMAWFGVRADLLQPWPDVTIALPLILSFAGSALWLVVVINAVNFMDGANGLSMGMAAIAALALAVAAFVIGEFNIATAAVILAGALAGFLVWNLPGRLFVGDTGAYFVGAMLAGLCLALVKGRPDLLFVPPILLMPFLSDVILTLIWRIRHGKNFWASHRDHAYQIAIKAGLKHWQVSAIHAFWALNAACIGVFAAIIGGAVPLIAFVVVLLLSTWLHLWVRKVGVKAGLVGAKIA
jgi:UDP-GlcNAc:undecaprenyl-phosphate/decaprenyl-phosphate GlcNAc-1-phosphate transferase